jgi:hypothetical protein
MGVISPMLQKHPGQTDANTVKNKISKLCRSASERLNELYEYGDPERVEGRPHCTLPGGMSVEYEGDHKKKNHVRGVQRGSNRHWGLFKWERKEEAQDGEQ